MDIEIQDWLTFLRESHGAVAVPLFLGGLGLMLFGWRMWRLCVLVSFGAIGAIVAYQFAAPAPDAWFYATLGGVALGSLCFVQTRYSVALLGTTLGGGVLLAYLSNMGLTGLTLWGAVGAGLVMSAAYSITNRRRVVVYVTAFQGAFLVISGIVALLMNDSSSYGVLRGMAEDSFIVVPFVLLVPTVVSCFYQFAEVKRLHAVV